jgi:hypothetical protein
MAYTDIISLANAKTYLGVDGSDRDTEITQMINAALSYIERNTNYVMSAQNKTYLLDDGEVRVYDYPINTLDADLDDTVTRTQKPLYSIYKDTSTATTITLNVGGTDIPNDLIQAGYLLLEHFFNEKETGNRLYTLDTTRFPAAAEQIIANNRRFIL